MHTHGLIERRYDVTIMDTNGNTHRLQVDTPCICDMRSWVDGLDLPIAADFLDVRLSIDSVPEGVPSD